MHGVTSGNRVILDLAFELREGDMKSRMERRSGAVVAATLWGEGENVAFISLIHALPTFPSQSLDSTKCKAHYFQNGPIRKGEQ
jgi:hypothetical protein